MAVGLAKTLRNFTRAVGFKSPSSHSPSLDFIALLGNRPRSALSPGTTEGGPAPKRLGSRAATRVSSSSTCACASIARKLPLRMFFTYFTDRPLSLEAADVARTERSERPLAKERQHVCDHVPTIVACLGAAHDVRLFGDPPLVVGRHGWPVWWCGHRDRRRRRDRAALPRAEVVV